MRELEKETETKRKRDVGKSSERSLTCLDNEFDYNTQNEMGPTIHSMNNG